jgi:hypothetical protein
MIPVCDYEVPAMPTQHAIRRLWHLARLRLQPHADDPIRPGDGLQAPALKLLDDLAGPPAFGSLIDELEAAVQGWHKESQGAPWLRLVVLPPCDTEDLVSTWAAAHHHPLLPAPARASLQNPLGTVDLKNAPGGPDELLVLPRLEDWFLRRRDGLATIRSLLEALSRLERPCLVGCNSWAWAFVAKAVGATLVLPSPVTFAPLDAAHLRNWFIDLAKGEEIARSADPGAMNPSESTDTPDDDRPPVVFRMASSGANVLGDDQDGGHDSFLRQLASLSLGTPWVAWHLWRESLRTASDTNELSDKVKKATEGDARTLWVTQVPEFKLPADHEQASLLVLQALLMHGSLTEPELRSVLPMLEEPGMVAALQSAGFVERCGDDGQLRVRPAAYPAVRTALKADGYPVGEL